VTETGSATGSRASYPPLDLDSLLDVLRCCRMALARPLLQSSTSPFMTLETQCRSSVEPREQQVHASHASIIPKDCEDL